MPRRWQSVKAAKAGRSDTRMTASKSGNGPGIGTIAHVPPRIEIGGDPAAARRSTEIPAAAKAAINPALRQVAHRPFGRRVGRVKAWP
jgi:hypothetical protein